MTTLSWAVGSLRAPMKTAGCSETHREARQLFRQASRLDPELAEAHGWIARVGAGIVAYGWSEEPVRDIREALDAGLRAIQLDEKNPYSHYALAISSAYANAQEQAVLAAEKAIDMSPSFALGHLVLGMALLFRGGAGQAIGPLERGLMLNAHDPQGFAWYNLLAIAQLFAGQAEAARAAAIRARQLRPTWRPAIESLACSYVALGRMEDARACVVELGELDKPPGDTLAPFRLRNPQWAQHMQHSLEAARRPGCA